MPGHNPLRHHYAPVFYLKAWCDADGKLSSYRWEGERLITGRNAPRSVGYEELLYSFTNLPEEKRQWLETEFFSREVDNNAASALSILKAEGVSSLSAGKPPQRRSSLRLQRHKRTPWPDGPNGPCFEPSGSVH